MPSSTLITQVFLALLPSLQHGRSRPVIVRRSPLPIAGLSKNDPRVFTATLDRKTGIDFGCDLTLSWAYVLALDPDGSAAREGSVLKGDQLVAVAGASVLGAPIGQVMEALAALEGAEVDLMFFRGPRTLLRELTGANTLEKTTVRITVEEPGKAARELVVPYGANLRDELVKEEINVYQSVTRWTNCNGKQLCGTCIVDVTEGVDNCTRRSLDEASTLRENPLTYKLACITNVYGDVTVAITPKVGAAQWTR
jgi:ferredoxin